MLLDFMRREKRRLLWPLLVLLILGMVAYLVPGLTGWNWGVGPLDSSVLAKVGGQKISAEAFRLSYARFLKNSQIPYDKTFLKQLHFDQQYLTQLIDKEVMLAEAKRLGVSVTTRDIQQRILAIPVFTDNGVFQMPRYQAYLENENMTPQEFESDVEAEIVQNRLRSLVTSAVSVSEAELEAEYRKRNEKVKISYVVFEPSNFASSVAVTEPELMTYFNANREKYRQPEQRQAKYLFIDSAQLRQSVNVPEGDIRNYYEQNIQAYTLPEKVHAAHILFKTAGKTPEEVEKIRAKAADVLAQIKKGGDFAALAKKYSEDSSASNGGDLGSFVRGQMVPEFDQVAFTLPAGATSDLVTTQFGIHIIRVMERQPARVQKLEEVASLIQPTLAQRKADQLAQDLSDKAYSRTKSNQTLEQVAAELKMKVETTPFFAAGADLPVIGNTPEFSTKVFALQLKEIGSPTRIPQGYVIPQLMEIKAPYLPELAEVKDKVEQDFKGAKAVQLAQKKAADFAAAIKGGAKFEAAAKTFAATVKEGGPFARGGSLPELGSTEALDEFLFSAKVGDISQPAPYGQKQVVAQLKEKIAVTAEDYAKDRGALLGSMLEQRQQEVFQSYLTEAKSRMIKSGKIQINQKAFEEVSRRL